MPKRPIQTVGGFTPMDMSGGHTVGQPNKKAIGPVAGFMPANTGGGHTVDGPDYNPAVPANPFPAAPKPKVPTTGNFKPTDVTGGQVIGQPVGTAPTGQGVTDGNKFHAFKAPVPSAFGYAADKATLPYKVNKLLKEGSPLLDTVRTRNQEGGEARGLLNSASNLRSGDAAVIDKAIQLTAPGAAAEQQRLSAQQGAANAGALEQQREAYGSQLQDRAGAISGALESQRQGFTGRIEKEKNAFQKELAQMGYDAQKVQAMSTIYGNLVDSQLSAMGQIMRTPDQTWTQNMQDDFEKVINASKPWLASLFDIPLS